VMRVMKRAREMMGKGTRCHHKRSVILPPILALDWLLLALA
jgi:hypothetical protein